MNLKEDTKKNLVSFSEQVQLWIPAFIFANTDENEAIVNDEKATINIKRVGRWAYSNYNSNLKTKKTLVKLIIQFGPEFPGPDPRDE